MVIHYENNLSSLSETDFTLLGFERDFSSTKGEER